MGSKWTIYNNMKQKLVFILVRKKDLENSSQNLQDNQPKFYVSRDISVTRQKKLVIEKYV